MQCIFCHNDSTTSRSEEHIIPESLGNKDYILPKGYVCDECNNYFAVKIERELLAQPYFRSMRFRNEILTKRGRLVKETMIFPDAMKSCEVVMHKSDSGLIVSFDDKLLYEEIKAGRITEMYSQYLPEPEYPSSIVSRFLAKCAYEYFLYIEGSDKYDLCVREILGSKSDIMKDLREYARYGKGAFWHYSQRRIYSEGDCFVGEDKKPYEILHEMKYFTKEYEHHPNGIIEAEIYYVIAIAGIEYAICISDPDITEYKKWIEEHNGLSPLHEDGEIRIFSLSAINPLLMRKNDKRIHNDEEDTCS